MMLKTGIIGKQEVVVSQNNTAEVVGSGQLPVFATPAMIALIEKTAWMSVADELEQGQGSVGTRLDVAHTSATPVGMKVWCETELTEIDKRRLVFKVNVFDESGEIGKGTHERFIIQNDKFLKKAESKKD